MDYYYKAWKELSYKKNVIVFQVYPLSRHIQENMYMAQCT
jgi:hypothetical protein